MALFVPPVALARKLGQDSLRLDAPDVGSLLQEVRKRVGENDWPAGLHATVLVNGVAISRLQGMATPLGPEDQVWLALPAGGG